jgi:hypothetical protein
LHDELTKKIVERFDYLKVFLPHFGRVPEGRGGLKNNKTPLSLSDIAPFLDRLGRGDNSRPFRRFS